MVGEHNLPIKMWLFEIQKNRQFSLEVHSLHAFGQRAALCSELLYPHHRNRGISCQHLVSYGRPFLQAWAGC